METLLVLRWLLRGACKIHGHTMLVKARHQDLVILSWSSDSDRGSVGDTAP